MTDLKKLFDEIQSELFKIVETYYKKVQLIEAIVTTSDVRYVDDTIRSKLRDILVLIQNELCEDKNDLEVWKRVESKLNEFSSLMKTPDYEEVFEWLHRRKFIRKGDESSRLQEIGKYAQKVKRELRALRKVLLNQEKIISNLLKKYDYKNLLKLFNLILHSEIDKYSGYQIHNPEEDIIEYGLYLDVKKASKELIELVRLLEDEIKIVNASENEDRDAINFVKNLIKFVEDKKIDTVIFIDKSARPFSYAFLLLYKRMHLFGRPKIFNVNWHRSQQIWFEIKYSEYHQNEYTVAYRANDFGSIKEIAIKKYTFLRNLSRNCLGKNVLIVDDVIDQGTTIISFKEFIEKLFQPKHLYLYTFAKYSWINVKDVKVFISGFDGTKQKLNWQKGIRGAALIDSGKGYSTTMFSKYKKYAPQFEYLREKIMMAKRHIENAVQKHG